ncbi:MAG TPA: tripartite tricarboxylate transporter substrate binding protein [Burkholderiales bacterium]|jgi:tripartite-type tricarboxylate transporter receptor subunit TctC
MLKTLFAAACAAALLPAACLAADFPQKNIEFIIPFGPGGGFDRTVRAIAPFMEKQLGGKVSVLPRNVPGAGGKRGMATVYRAKPDGYTIAIANIPGAAIPALTGEKVEYDINKLTWIARLATEEYTLAVATKSSIRSIEDLRKLGRPVKMPSTDFGSTAYAGMAIFGEMLKFPVQHLTGYKGTNDYIVAVVRGDGDATTGPISTMGKFVESGDMRALFTTEEKSTLKGVPTIAELGYPDLTGLGVDRFVVGPPGLPPAIIKALSDAMAKAVQDPELQAIAEKSRQPFAFLPPDKAKANADRSLALYARYKAALQKR